MKTLLLSLLTCGILSLVACNDLRTPRGSASAPVALAVEQRFWPGGDNGGKERRWTRDNFRGVVGGKAQEWVLKELGSPDRVETNPRGGSGVGWVYQGVTYVPPSKTNDQWVMVYFDGADGPPFQPCNKVMFSDGGIYAAP